MYNKYLPWFHCYAFINLGRIIVLTPPTMLHTLKPVQQYGQLKGVTME